MRSKLAILAAFLLLAAVISPARAMKLQNLPLMAEFHLGLVAGLGTGLDFGAKAYLPLENLKLGLEIEQLVTDYNYSANINCLRLGGTLSLSLSPNFTLNGHFGTLGFQSSQDFVYRDTSGANQNITANINYKGAYYGGSLDYAIWGVVITPKYLINNVTDKGPYSEFDLNIGKNL
jgi:hypothetical protein